MCGPFFGSLVRSFHRRLVSGWSALPKNRIQTRTVLGVNGYIAIEGGVELAILVNACPNLALCFFNMLDNKGMRNIVADAMDQPGKTVFLIVIGVILVDIVIGIIMSEDELRRAGHASKRTPTHSRPAVAMPLFGVLRSITQRSAPSAAGDSTTSTRSISSEQDVFDRGLALGFQVWLAMPGAAFEKHGMTWNETTTHATLSLPVTPAMCESLKCACKESPEDPTTSRVIKVR